MRISITGELAQAAASVARDHPGCSITIEWIDDGTYDVREWLISADDGVTAWTYLADDETGLRVRRSTAGVSS